MTTNMVLPPSAALLFFLIFQRLSRRAGQPWGWRASVLLAGTAWGSMVVALTELLSLVRRLDARGLTIGWVIACAAPLAVLVWAGRRPGPQPPPFLRQRNDAWRWIRELGPFNWVLFALLAAQAVALAVVALSYAPNAFESMRYHLPRVMHWLQNGSLASFASSNVRENYFPPFAEYVFLHLIALTGGDGYVNVAQVVALLVCLVGVSEIAGQMGAGRNAQIASAALAAGIPLAVLQATSPRNDLVLSVWLVSLVCFGWRWARRPSSWLWLVGTGLSLGLALLTKATAFVYAFPICVMVGVAALRAGGARLGLSRGAVVVLLALALNLGHVTRNWALYGSPRGAWGRVGTEVTTPAIVASTAIRNVALHMPTDCSPPLSFLDAPGRLSLRGLEALHSLTGKDPVDPGTTWGIENIFEGSPGCAYDEQEGGNAIHALLIFLAALALPFMRSVRPSTRWLALALVAGFLLLSLFVRWQIWAGYLQLPLFILWAPVVAIVLGQVRSATLARGVALLVVLLSFLWIYNNRLRPLSRLLDGTVPTRDQQYFSYHQMATFIYPQYRAVASLVAETGCQKVGLRVNSPVLEYPFWVLLRQEGFTGELQHVDVGNELGAYEDPAFGRCAVISEDAGYDPASSMRVQRVGPFHVYLGETAALPRAAP